MGDGVGEFTVLFFLSYKANDFVFALLNPTIIHLAKAVLKFYSAPNKSTFRALVSNLI